MSEESNSSEDWPKAKPVMTALIVRTSYWSIAKDQCWTLNRSLKVIENPLTHEVFGFDHIYDSTRCKDDIFGDLILPLVKDWVDGISGTIMLYEGCARGNSDFIFGKLDYPGLAYQSIYTALEMIARDGSDDSLLFLSCVEIEGDAVYDVIAGSSSHWVDPVAPEVTPIQQMSDAREVPFYNEFETISQLHKLADRREKRITSAQANTPVHCILEMKIESHNPEYPERSGLSSILRIVDLVGSREPSSGPKHTTQHRKDKSDCTQLRDAVRHLGGVRAEECLRDLLSGSANICVLAFTSLDCKQERKTLKFLQDADEMVVYPVLSTAVRNHRVLPDFGETLVDQRDRLRDLLDAYNAETVAAENRIKMELLPAFKEKCDLLTAAIPSTVREIVVRGHQPVLNPPATSAPAEKRERAVGECETRAERAWVDIDLHLRLSKSGSLCTVAYNNTATGPDALRDPRPPRHTASRVNKAVQCGDFYPDFRNDKEIRMEWEQYVMTFLDHE